MLSCQYTILKMGKDGKLYRPKKQHRILRFFRDDLFGWVSWLLPEKEPEEYNQKPDSPKPES